MLRIHPGAGDECVLLPDTFKSCTRILRIKRIFKGLKRSIRAHLCQSVDEIEANVQTVRLLVTIGWNTDDTMSFEFPQYTDVGGAARTPAAENETDTRSLGERQCGRK